MPDLPTRTDLFNVFAAEILARARTRSTGRQITVDQIFNPGSDVNLIGAGGSAMAEEVMRQLARSTAETTLDGSSGAALDRWVADRYASLIVRKSASPARVPVVFARTVGGGAYTYPAGSRIGTPGGVQFETLSDVPFGVGSVGPITVNARALNAGTGGNVTPGSITRFITAPADPSLVVTNAVAATGGDATETDVSFRERVRLFFFALARGTVAAVEYGARTVPGVRQATAIEEGDGTGVLTGRMFLYIADANGQANTALIAEVVAALREYRCGGINVIVTGGLPVFVSIEYHLSFITNVDTVLAFDQVRQSTVARVNQLAPMVTLQRSLLFEIARSVPGVIVNANAITTPAGDIVPTPNSGEVIRTRPDLVTNV